MVERIRKAGAVSVDTETDNISPTRARLVGFSLAVEPGRACYVPLRHAYMGAPDQIPVDAGAGPSSAASWRIPAIRKIGQNIKYDLIVLEREGRHACAGLDLDTMVLSYLLEPNWGKHNLDRLAAGLPRRGVHPLPGRSSARARTRSPWTWPRSSRSRPTPARTPISPWP